MTRVDPAPRPFGVYVHVPFCRHRCDYCAFATYTDRDHLVARYVDACVREIAVAVESGDIGPVTSVFFGGGTPSRIPADDLVRILRAVSTARGAEVTVECNPEDATDDRLRAYRDGGATRISFGVQSTARHVLRALGRRHDPVTVPRAVEAAALAGIEHVNVDLIYGATTETDADWERTVEDVLALDPRPCHVSAYALTVEPGTPLASDSSRHPDDDAQATRYEIVDEILTSAGYRWEEVSNWALPGHECRHNALYWRQGDYRGVGSAAHSHRDGHRWWNVRTPDRYVEAVESGRSTVAGDEHVVGERRALEAMMLSLRTPEGAPWSAFAPGAPIEGLVERVGERGVLTRRGRLLANLVTQMLTLDACGDAAPGAPREADLEGWPRYGAHP